MIDYIKYPVINYKAVRLYTTNKQYIFDVDIRLTKPQIKTLFENYFNINIVNINTHLQPRKKRKYTSIPGYKNRYKRVIIKLKPDQSIPYVDDLFNGFLKQILSKRNAQSNQETGSSNE